MLTQQVLTGELLAYQGKLPPDLPSFPDAETLTRGIRRVGSGFESLREAGFIYRDLEHLTPALIEIIYGALYLASASGLDLTRDFSDYHQKVISQYIPYGE